MALSQEIALRERTGPDQRCPYCHDALAETGVGEELPCRSCGTLHHEVCLDELGGCTVLGCGGGKARPLASVEEVRARVRERLERFLEHTQRPRAPEELERIAREGWVCERCSARLWSLDCARCGADLEERCRGANHPCPTCGLESPGPRPEETTGARPRGERPDLRVPLALSGVALLGGVAAVLAFVLWALRESGL